MVQQVRIISLGEVITPHIMNAIQAFANIVHEKNGEDKSLIIRKIGGFFNQPVFKEQVNRFKLGFLDESEFTKNMTSALSHHLDMALTEEEFNQAWHAMNPSFDQFADLLKQAMAYNNQSDKKLVFISYTNPKDIKHIIHELDKNGLDYELNEQGHLIKIGGIELYTTYACQMTKSDLITFVIKKTNNPACSQSYLANSISQGLGGEKEAAQPILIKYIRGKNEITHQPLKEDLDRTNEEVEKKAENFMVDTIIWDKTQTLFDTLNNDELVSEPIAVCKL